ELLPGPDSRVREQDLAAFHRRGRRGGAGRRWYRSRRCLHDHSAAVDGEERGAAGERGRAVTDDDHGTALLEALERVDDRGLGLRVHRARGLVQDQHGTVLQERARQRDALPLAARQLHAPLADLGFIALRETLDAWTRGRTRMRVVLPAQVGPTMPSGVPAAISPGTSCKTGRSGP